MTLHSQEVIPPYRVTTRLFWCIKPTNLCCHFSSPWQPKALFLMAPASAANVIANTGTKRMGVISQLTLSQPSHVLQVFSWQSLPILKESGPPAVLLTNMAKKSRSTQAVSIFYESSWVLPRGCPCHSHLQQDTTYTLHTCSTALVNLHPNSTRVVQGHCCFAGNLCHLETKWNSQLLFTFLEGQCTAFKSSTELKDKSEDSWIAVSLFQNDATEAACWFRLWFATCFAPFLHAASSPLASPESIFHFSFIGLI